MNNLTELKAKAYDLIAQMEIIQRQLAEINASIAKLIEEQKKENDSGNSDINN